MFNILFSLLASVVLFSSTPGIIHAKAPDTVLATETYSLLDRYSNTYVNNVFSDNILLTLAYMSGKVKEGQKFSWNSVRADQQYAIILQPGQTFAFHDSVLPQYQGKISVTTNAHFDSQEGFESDGYLVGDGVCHLASFMNVAAKAAGLAVVAPTPHDFAHIPDVAKKDGVAIYDSPDSPSGSALQNLYVTNNKEKPIAFVFTNKNHTLEIQVKELN
jgi:hypothetical protein